MYEIAKKTPVKVKWGWLRGLPGLHGGQMHECMNILCKCHPAEGGGASQMANLNAAVYRRKLSRCGLGNRGCV